MNSDGIFKIIRKIVNCFLLLLFFNSVYLFVSLNIYIALKILTVIALLAFYVYFNIKPSGTRRSRTKVPTLPLRVHVLIGGRECVLMAMACFLLELLLYISIIFFKLGTGPVSIGKEILIINGLVCIVFMGVLAMNGFVRILAASKQVGISTKILFILLWWVPVINIILLKKLCSSAVKEYVFFTKKASLNENRRHEEVCKTKYPILLVHGVFWRDWKVRIIWGRIPDELTANGANVFFGNNRSSASVAESGAELADRIKSIVTETGCEKLNIIAHSKGGLDSRYAISCMGMGKYTASLTTICTPHYGCPSIRKLVERIPKKAIHYVNKNYETLYTILGDENPDFLNGLAGITDTECAVLNEQMPDDPSVYYQSVGAKMKKCARRSIRSF
jgi:triacylglycerol lipase